MKAGIRPRLRQAARARGKIPQPFPSAILDQPYEMILVSTSFACLLRFHKALDHGAGWGSPSDKIEDIFWGVAHSVGFQAGGGLILTTAVRRKAAVHCRIPSLQVAQ